MITQEQSNYLLQSLGEAYGQDLALDEDGCCTLVSLEGHHIQIIHKADEGEIQFHAVIGELPEDDKLAAKLLRKFFMTNLLWMDSLGSTFALNDGKNAIVMQKRYGDGEALESVFIQFVKEFDIQLDFWIEQFLVEDEDSVSETSVNHSDDLAWLYTQTCNNIWLKA